MQVRPLLRYISKIAENMANSKRHMLLISSSRLHGHEYLQHCRDHIDLLLKKSNVKKILFIPYALRDYAAYTKLVEEPLSNWGYIVEGIHSSFDECEAVQNAQAIFIGGGNTFVLLKTLLERNLFEPIREKVLKDGIPYIGSSAGTNVATISIHTTNDMPIVHPCTFDALNLVPFNINPHYIEPDPNTKHKGETRDQRLEEFIAYNNRPVLGLREGSSLYIEGNKMTLLGDFSARLFKVDLTKEDYPPQSDMSFLLEL